MKPALTSVVRALVPGRALAVWSLQTKDGRVVLRDVAANLKQGDAAAKRAAEWLGALSLEKSDRAHPDHH
jgi:hypothetical protein